MPSYTKKTLKIFWQHAWRYKWQAVFLIVGILGVEGMQTYIPLFYRNLFNLLAGQRSENLFEGGIKIVLIIFLLNFLKFSLWRLVNFVNSKFSGNVMANLTNTCYKYLQQHSYNFFSSNFVGSLVTKVKRYERAFETIADQIVYDLGRAALITALILFILFWQYPFFAWVILIWTIVYFSFAYLFSLYKLPWDIKRALADTKTTAQLADSITNNINIKLFSNYQEENKRFKEVTDNQKFLRVKSWTLGNWSDVVQGILVVFLEFGVIFWAVVLWRHGTFTVGDIVLLQAYIYRISDKLWNTGKNIRNIYEAVADANEMTEMLSRPHEVTDIINAKNLAVKNPSIKLSNVNFIYNNGQKVFDNFNLIINPGEKIAIIGPSGAGKTTFVKLLLRFANLNSGQIFIDCQDISKVTQDSLRSAISFVPQEPILFHRSLMENIRYGKLTATEEEVKKAARAAHAHEFISKLKYGYETFVGERGIKLSGGERQRVAIARAILKNAPILVLDEATSSLDSESEMFIQDALKNLMSQKTAIVIAHRLSTIMQMDRIVVLENGKIIEEGKHKELLKLNQGTYQRLWHIQAGGFA